MEVKLKRILPQSIRTYIKQWLGMPTTRLHPSWEVLKVIGANPVDHVVIDVGAHHGWFLHCWLDWCPAGKVYAFEPYPESFEHMQHLYGNDGRVEMVRAGVSARSGWMELNILKGSKVSNSFLSPNKHGWGLIEYSTGEIEQLSVPVISLDEYCHKEGLGNIWLIKIDVQGFELEVLKGGDEVLQNTSYVFVESGIERLYEGAPSFADVCLFMESCGFHLITMRAWHRGNSRLIETDLLFRRNGLEPGIDRSCDRHYVSLR